VISFAPVGRKIKCPALAHTFSIVVLTDYRIRATRPL
jgi:hypothetical protein